MINLHKNYVAKLNVGWVGWGGANHMKHQINLIPVICHLLQFCFNGNLTFNKCIKSGIITNMLNFKTAIWNRKKYSTFFCCCEGFFDISCLADNLHEMPNLIFSEIDDIFIIFSRQQDFIFHANCLQMETICMKCQNQFSDKNLRKKIQYVVCWIF